MTTPSATTSASTFRLETSVSIAIKAAPEVIWALLTDAARFPVWNSTVTSVDGTIAKGERLALRVPAAPKRVFRPSVVELEPNRRMVWVEGAPVMFRGVRTFTLAPREDGRTEFTMTEVLRGLAVPMAKGSLPDFAPIFETYAADLRRAAERA